MKKNLNNVIPHIPTKLALSNEEVEGLNIKVLFTIDQVIGDFKK